MTLTRDQRLRRGDIAAQGQDLSPREYFVLSRIDGTPSVAEVLASSGLGSVETETILQKLLDIRALIPIVPGQVSEPERRIRPIAERLRANARERRRQVLRAELESQPSSPTSYSAPAEEEETVPPNPPAKADPHFHMELLRLDDPRLDKSLDIKIDDQRWVLALADGQDRWTPFEFLGLVATHDEKLIKRAYHETSRRLHPDSYFGRSLGLYHDILAELFKRARFYYSELRKPEVRAPYVDRVLEEVARRRHEADAAEARAAVADEMRQRQEEAEAAVRRQQRAVVQAERQAQRVRDRLREEARTHATAAAEAERAENLAGAANLYRLALRADPDNAEYRTRWNDCRARARKVRAAEAFSQAQRYLEFGQTKEALPLLVEAAQAHANVDYLAHAADAVRETDPIQARNFAMGALDALASEPIEGKTKRRSSELAAIHVKVARAFLSVGQKESAKQQALVAQEHRPDDPDVRALLKSLKLK